MVTELFQWVKRRGLALNTHPSNAKIKEKVELHLYSLSAPSMPVPGRTIRICNIIFK
jgi:hypothetical protein